MIDLTHLLLQIDFNTIGMPDPDAFIQQVYIDNLEDDFTRYLLALASTTAFKMLIRA